jgi:DNA processing protein
MDEQISLIALERNPLVPQYLKKKLLEKYLSANAIFERAKDSSEIRESFGPKVELALKEEGFFEKAERELDLAKNRSIDVIYYNSGEYPKNLKNISDPPLVMTKIGKTIPDSRLFISVVGARHCTQYGKKFSFEIARDLTRTGVLVVSGMAAGVDAMAHKGALEVPGGHTIAVLGSGLLNPYPSQNMGLFKEICEKGTVISEFHPQESPIPDNFPRRNRIIAGLSQGTVVVEAGYRSGAGITARLALEYDRETFAVPGRIDSNMSIGTNRLIARGQAKLTTSAIDILIEFEKFKDIYGFRIPDEVLQPEVDLSTEEKNLLNYLKKGETSDIDSLSQKSGLQIYRIIDILVGLELKGVVARKPGNQVEREA